MNIKNKIKNLQDKKTSFSLKTLGYLVLFSLVIILFLWMFQVIFLQISYEHYQLKNMNTIVKSIEESNLNNLDEVLLTLAYQNSVCIEYEASNGNTVSYNTMMVLILIKVMFLFTVL